MLFVLLFLLLSFSSCEHKTEPPPPPPVDVSIFTVEPRTVPITPEYVGFANSSHPVEIRARVEGYLDSIAYTEGSLVKEGQLLFQIDPKPLQAEVDKAKGELMRQQAVLENAKLTVDRLAPLYQKKAASKRDLDNAIANKLQAEASVVSAGAQLALAEINLGYATIQSPVTGLSDKAKWREGALINPGTNSLMTTISVVDPIWVVFTVSDNDILKYQRDIREKIIKGPSDEVYEVEAILMDGSTFPYKGIVDFSSPTYDQTTGSLSVRGVFPNPEVILRPGQFVRVRVLGSVRPNTIYVPQRAVQEGKKNNFVYVVRNGHAEVQVVEVGDWYGENQIITSGLKAEDEVIVDGVNKVKNNTLVRVIGPYKQPEKTNK